MSYPRYQAARGFKTARRTAGNVSSPTGWGNFDTALDLVLAAQVGDYIEASVSAFVNSENGEVALDVGTLVSAAIVNVFSTGTTESSTGSGVAGWFQSNSIFNSIGSPILYPLVAGDLSAGTVTLRLRIRNTNAPGAGKSIRANAAQPFVWTVKNLGPADPN